MQHDMAIVAARALNIEPPFLTCPRPSADIRLDRHRVMANRERLLGALERGRIGLSLREKGQLKAKGKPKPSKKPAQKKPIAAPATTTTASEARIVVRAASRPRSGAAASTRASRAAPGSRKRRKTMPAEREEELEAEEEAAAAVDMVLASDDETEEDSDDEDMPDALPPGEQPSSDRRVDGDYAEVRRYNAVLIKFGMLDPPSRDEDTEAWWTTQHSIQDRFRHKIP
mmetsp:Transcript_13217/g.52989  ORF Transcript_13217/g.52989 Transcript_13217/m.52989 type:complete len:228 (+) Transcript_13217:1306-1989(+)